MKKIMLSMPNQAKYVAFYVLAAEATLLGLAKYLGDYSTEIVIALGISFLYLGFASIYWSSQQAKISDVFEKNYFPTVRNTPIAEFDFNELYRKKSSLTLIFSGEESERLTTQELSHYLEYLRATYVSLLYITRIMDREINEDDVDTYIQRLSSFIETNRGQAILDDCNGLDIGEHELEIIKLTKNSPIEFVITGSISALVLAVIISGGEVDFKIAKFKLKPLGDGLNKLRNALGIKEKSPNKKINKDASR